MLDLEKVSIHILSAPSIFKSFLGLVEYGSDHFVLEITKFKELKLDCKEKIVHDFSPIWTGLFAMVTNSRWSA